MNLRFFGPIYISTSKIIHKYRERKATSSNPPIYTVNIGQYNLKTQTRRIAIHNNKGGDIAVRGDRYAQQCRQHW
jgi:hypothetical protein